MKVVWSKQAKTWVTNNIKRGGLSLGLPLAKYVIREQKKVKSLMIQSCNSIGQHYLGRYGCVFLF